MFAPFRGFLSIIYMIIHVFLSTFAEDFEEYIIIQIIFIWT